MRTTNASSFPPFGRIGLAGLLAPLAAALLLAGCAEPERVHDAEPRHTLPPISTAPYDGPQAKVSLHQAEIGRIIEVQTTVPTGGHRLILDHADVIDGDAVMFLTLVQPAPDEVVTMALETLRETFETDRRFALARVYIRTHERGEVPPEDYRLAAEQRRE